MSMSRVRVLVTGGAGFLGGHVVDELNGLGCELAVVDSLVPQVHQIGLWPSWLPESVERRRIDVRDRPALQEFLEEWRPHCIVHLAAEVGVGQAEVEIERYVDANVRGTAVLLESILAANQTAEELDGVRRLIVASSMSAYGEGYWACPKHGPVRVQRRAEDVAIGRWTPRCAFHTDPDERCEADLIPTPTPEWASLRPGGVYAATKRDQEELSLLVSGARGLSTAACRFFNLYGPRQAASNPYTGIVVGFGARARQGLRPRVYEDGHQVRDLTHVSDAARAVSTLVGSWQLSAAIRLWQSPGHQGSFNVGTGEATTVLEVAKAACWIVDPKLEPEVTGEFRVGDIRACLADVDRLRAIGWSPTISAKEGLGALYAEMAVAPVPGGDLDAAHEQVRAAGLTIAVEPTTEEDETPSPPTWGG